MKNNERFPQSGEFTARQKIAFAMVFAGFILMLATVGKMEYETILDPKEIGTMLIGSLALMFGAAPVSGDLEIRDTIRLFKAKRNR